MKLLPVLALFGFIAFSPFTAQTTQAYQITVSSENYPYQPYSFSLTSNPSFTGVATASYDSNYGADVWSWTNHSLETPIFHALTGSSITGNFTSLYSEKLSISSKGFFTYSITASGLSYQSETLTAYGWGLNLQTYTFPTESISVSDFLASMTGNQVALGSINFLFGNNTGISPGISSLSVQPVSVPEPSSILLIGGAGIVAFWALRAKRRG